MNSGEASRDMPSNCPQCGAALPRSALEELCPACLLQQGADTETGAPSESSGFQPPGVDEVARLFPQLEILAFIGKGGMGAVYKARQPALDRFVALKILPSQSAGGPGFAERFNREARALARLNHPNIVAVHEFGVAAAGILPAVKPDVPPGGKTMFGREHEENPDDCPGGKMPPSTAGETPAPAGLPFFIMEYVDGLNLRQLERAGKLSPREALQIVPQICEALQFAHEEGIVHRDIKPENILLDKKGRVKIADFGIAKIMGREPEVAITETKGALGTPHYMAPEQVEKPHTVDHRADIFSLGVVFYEMLTGELPLGKFAAPSRKVRVDVRLDEIVLRALEKEPELRYQQASQVKTDVETVAFGVAASEGQGSKALPPERRGHPSGWRAWVPFQPSEVKAIYAHMTDAEKRRDLKLQVAGVSGCILLTLALILLHDLLPEGHRASTHLGGLGVIALLQVIWLVLSIGKSKEFLCSTEWARAKGFTPEQIKLFSLGKRGMRIAFAVLLAVLLAIAVPNLIKAPRMPPLAQHIQTDSAASDSSKPPRLAAPPVVIRTIPESGASGVDPSLTELQATFSKPMHNGDPSWTAWRAENFPETTASPRYLEDQRTCVLPVRLRPGKVYALWLNSENSRHFKDRQEVPAVPYLLIFETRK